MQDGKLSLPQQVVPAIIVSNRDSRSRTFFTTVVRLCVRIAVWCSSDFSKDPPHLVALPRKEDLFLFFFSHSPTNTSTRTKSTKSQPHFFRAGRSCFFFHRENRARRSAAAYCSCTCKPYLVPCRYSWYWCIRVENLYTAARIVSVVFYVLLRMRTWRPGDCGRAATLISKVICCWWMMGAADCRSPSQQGCRRCKGKKMDAEGKKKNDYKRCDGAAAAPPPPPPKQYYCQYLFYSNMLCVGRFICVFVTYSNS